MAKKKYDLKYIQEAEKRIEQILHDTREYDDWTQIWSTNLMVLFLKW